MSTNDPAVQAEINAAWEQYNRENPTVEPTAAEIERAWQEIERHNDELEEQKIQADIKKYEDEKPCPICGHPQGKHNGPECTIPGCDCLEKMYDMLYGDEEEETELKEVWFTEPPCGHRGYE